MIFYNQELYIWSKQYEVPNLSREFTCGVACFCI